MPTPQTFSDVTLVLSGTRQSSASLTVPASYQRVDMAIVSTTPAWNTLDRDDRLTFGLEYFDGAAWRFLVGNDPAAGGRLGRAMAQDRRLSRGGGLPRLGGGPWPHIDGRSLRVFARTTAANLTLVARVTIS